MEPLEALAHCLRGERPFLLDGACDADGLGRFSFAGCDPDDAVKIASSAGARAPEMLEAAQRRWTTGPVDDKPWPLAVGWISYDLGEAICARKPFASVDERGLPVVDFARYPAVWRFDRVSGRAEVLATHSAAAERLLARFSRTPPPWQPVAARAMWETGDDVHKARVARALDYLRAGDAYQVNIAQRVRVPLDELALPSLYRALRTVAPAPLGAYLQTDDATILSNTPELFLRSERVMSPIGWRIETRPIKGTRPRGATPESDRALAAELEASTKDDAEHLMIVDLLRNDLGRVVQTGTVDVESYRRRIELPTVHHLVSTVSGRAPDTIGLAALLRATFPGGSVTGAPKIRAMEIIDELEGVRRGPYCGAIGWLGPGTRFDLALAIRTGTWTRGDGELVWSVGGGIVADSTPEGELDETRVKARALLAALE
jgi:para-aminobenzoate synthetase component 1